MAFYSQVNVLSHIPAASHFCDWLGRVAVCDVMLQVEAVNFFRALSRWRRFRAPIALFDMRGSVWQFLRHAPGREWATLQRPSSEGWLAV